MTRVSYLVKKNGLKGSIKEPTLERAQAKAKQIGGYYKTVYTEINESVMTPKDLERREKRMAYFGIKTA